LANALRDKTPPSTAFPALLDADCISRSSATRAVAETEKTSAVPVVPHYLAISNLDKADPAGEITGVGGNGTAVDPKSGHGFTGDHPKVSMLHSTTQRPRSRP
jgi:hypothetical protein